MGDYYGAYKAMEEMYKEGKLKAIGEKYGKTPAQVALRWNIQRGVVVIPKSTNKDRMEQNFDVFDFELSNEDMNEIGKLDLGHSEIVDHTNPNFIKMIHFSKLLHVFCPFIYLNASLPRHLVICLSIRAFIYPCLCLSLPSPSHPFSGISKGVSISRRSEYSIS